jgi:CBS domain-containing protein
MNTQRQRRAPAERRTAAAAPGARSTPAEANHVLLGASLAHAVAIMRDRDTDSLVVLGEGRRAVGVLSARAVCLAALRSNKPLSDLTVAAAAVRTVPPGTRPPVELRDFVRYVIAHSRAAERGDGNGAPPAAAGTEPERPAVRFVRVWLDPAGASARP